MDSKPRSLVLAAWTGSWLAGHASIDEVFAHLAERDDAVDALDEDGRPLGLHQVLASLQSQGADRLCLVLPVPGDPRGLPGGTPFAAAALAAGEGVLAIPPIGDAFGFAPEVTTHGTELEGRVTTVSWRVFRCRVPRGEPLPDLALAAADLRAATLEAATVLAGLDAVRWRPELGEALAGLRQDGRRGRTDGTTLPPGYPPAARSLLTQAGILDTVLDLALSEDKANGAVAPPGEAADRAAALAPVRAAVRRARCAAVNAQLAVAPATPSAPVIARPSHA